MQSSLGTELTLRLCALRVCGMSPGSSLVEERARSPEEFPRFTRSSTQLTGNARPFCGADAVRNEKVTRAVWWSEARPRMMHHPTRHPLPRFSPSVRRRFASTRLDQDQKHCLDLWS